MTEFHKSRYTDEEALHQWLRYLCIREDNMKGLETILESNPAIAKAHRLYEKFTADEQLMAQYDARQKYLRDVATIKGVSYDEGVEKGKQLGLEQGRQLGLEQGRQLGLEQGRQLGLEELNREIVITMHQKGLDAETITEYTNLSIEKVSDILKEPPPTHPFR